VPPTCGGALIIAKNEKNPRQVTHAWGSMGTLLVASTRLLAGWRVSRDGGLPPGRPMDEQVELSTQKATSSSSHAAF
jgi:hypothetical protein